MKKQSIWISYDLGIKGDYPNLYKWLDTHKAKECGNSVAFLNYEYQTDIVSELKEDIKKSVELKPGDRIYIVAKIPDRKTGDSSVTGKYIFGNRKATPWEGYAPVEDNEADVDA